MAGGLLIGCARAAPPTPTPSPSPTYHHIPPTATLTPSPTPAGTAPIWDGFAGPTLPAPTAIPPPLSGLRIDPEVRVALLAGIDQEAPYTGRTQALELVFYNPRLAKASLIAIHPDLYVYLPGFSMQRINAAYATGDVAMLVRTIEYNFGVRPDHWLIVHPSDFIRLVNDLEGITVPVLVGLPQDCGGIPGGERVMDGQVAFCYLRVQNPMDPFAGLRRQQEVVGALFWRLVHGGRLAALPDLYANFQPGVTTNFTLDELISDVPLALRLGDVDRIGYYQIDRDVVAAWQLSPNAVVFLPRREPLQALVQAALDAVQVPAPPSQLVATLEYELTQSPTPTATATATLTPTATATRRPTLTRTPTPRPTATASRAPSATASLTPTQTSTPTETGTPTPTPSPTVSPAP